MKINIASTLKKIEEINSLQKSKSSSLSEVLDQANKRLNRDISSVDPTGTAKNLYHFTPSAFFVQEQELSKLFCAGKLLHDSVEGICNALEVSAVVLWTRRLHHETVSYKGELVSLRNFVLKNKDKLVLKPANLGRGYGVFIGINLTESEWSDIVTKVSGDQYVVQEYVKPVRLNIMYHDGKDVVNQDMFHVGGLHIINGQFLGMFSRVSKNHISNVHAGGLFQPVIVHP